MHGISKAFGAVRALYQVDFEVRRGEVMALVGDNGAGKSTLIKGIAGIYPFDEGEVRFEGRPVDIHGPRDAARLGIEVVYQDLALADNLDVVANMFLGRERTRRGFVLDEPSMEHASRETLDSLSVTTLRSVRQSVAGLSGGQRQAVAVAKSVMWNSKLVILDEPTAALGVAQTRQVLDLVRRLAERDLGVVIISHNLHDVFEAPTGSRCSGSASGWRSSRRRGHQQEVVHAITAGALSTCRGWPTRRWRRDDREHDTRLGRGGPSAGRRPARPRQRTAAAHETVAGYMRRWWQGVRAGELGSLPIISGWSSSPSCSGCSTTRSSRSATSRTCCSRWRRSRRSPSASSSCC